MVVGQVVYLQDGLRPMGVARYWSPVRREPWIVESFANREVGAGRLVGGKWENVWMLGGHLVVLRSLRTGRLVTVADWLVCMSEELAGEWFARPAARRSAAAGRIGRRRLAVAA